METEPNEDEVVGEVLPPPPLDRYDAVSHAGGTFDLELSSTELSFTNAAPTAAAVPPAVQISMINSVSSFTSGRSAGCMMARADGSTVELLFSPASLTELMMKRHLSERDRLVAALEARRVTAAAQPDEQQQPPSVATDMPTAAGLQQQPSRLRRRRGRRPACAKGASCGRCCSESPPSSVPAR